MTIKNETAFTKECMEGAMRACEAGNSRYKTFIYGKMVGVKFSYEIDAENIIITDEENDSDTFSWNEVVKWNQDSDNMYLFVGDDNCLVVSKKGFTQESADDLRQLADAVIGMRDETGNSQQ